eukprot:14837434-Heterocapsa_arctica.AAC.1
MALATRNRWSIQLGDVSTAFLHAPIEELIFVRPQVNLHSEGQLWQLHKALYGLRRAPLLFQELLAKCLAELRFTRCVSEPQLYHNKYTGVLFSVHADDILMAGSEKELDSLIDDLKQKMNIEWGRRLPACAEGQPWVQYL